jgi:hypothetical protein
MTSDGVGGTAADGPAGAGSSNLPPRPLFIKRDDGCLAPRYIELAYNHTPAGGVTPHHPRRERQVALALRNTTDLMIVSMTRGAASRAGRRTAEARLCLRPPRRPVKGLR